MDDVAAAAPRQRMRLGLATAGVMIGTMVSVLGSSTVNVALVDIIHGVGAKIDTVDRVITSYMLALVLAIPLTGRLSERFGKRDLYVAGVALFTLASVAGGFATSLDFLVASRVVQGFGAGLMLPTGQAILFELYPVEKRGSAMAYYGVGAILAPAIGPTFGGFLVEAFGWRSLFYLGAPFAVVAVALVLRFIPRGRPARVAHHDGDARFDVLGLVALAACLTSLEIGLDLVVNNALAAIVLIASAFASGAFLIAREMRARRPLVDVRVFRHRGYALGIVANTMMGMGLYGGTYLVPLFLGGVEHKPALSIALVMLPGSLVMGAFMLFAGRAENVTRSASRLVAALFEGRVLVVVGLVITGASLAALGLVDESSGTSPFTAAYVARGVGIGLLYAPLSVVTLLPLWSEELVAGTALFNLSRQLGGAVGVALLKAVLALQSSRPLASAFDVAFVVCGVLVALGAIPGPWLERDRTRT